LRAKQSVPLGDLATFASGGTPSRTIAEYFEGNIPWVTGADLGDNDLITPRSFITDEAVNNSAVTVVPAGTILLVTRTSVGKVAIADRLLGFSQDITALTPNADLADIRYLRSFLRAYAPRLALQARGATISGVTRGVVAAIEVPLPPLAEQRRIASTLDDLDQLRRQRRAAIAATTELLTSAFIDEFGDPLRTASHRSAVTLESLCTAVVDCPHTTPSWTESGVLCIRTTNLARGEWRFDETRYVSAETHESRVKRARLEPGDIILSREGTVGIGAIVPPSMIASMGQRLVQLRPDQSRVLPEFLLSYLLEVLEPTRLSRLLVGSTALHVNVRDIRTLRVDVPPMERQLAFGKAVGVVRAKLELQRAHLAKLDELFASLQHRVFRGELSRTTPPSGA